MSTNLCPKCGKPIRIPQEDIEVVKMRTGLKGKPEDRMVHKVCPSTDSGQIGGQMYCAQCTHPRTIHSPRCSYSSYDYKCECKRFKG